MTTTSARLSQATQGFAHLLRKPPGPAPVPAPCAVRIVTGMHRGALLRLRHAAQLGSHEANDLVLRDADVRDRHAELRRVDGIWGVYDLQDGRAIPVLKSERRGRFLRQRHALGSAQLVITQALPVVPERTPLPRLIGRVLAPVALVFALSAIAIVTVQLVSPADARAVSGTRNLKAEGWPDVDITTTAPNQAQVRGHVEDNASLNRLQNWLRQNGHGQAAVTVFVGSELVARVRDALANETLRVDYQPGGIVRVQGTTMSMSVRDHMRRLAADLNGVVRLEDLIVYVEEPERPRTLTLPMRIVDARPGNEENGGSFGTDTGERYFVGAVMPDGSEVIAIREDSIEFSSAGRRIHYPLK